MYTCLQVAGRGSIKEFLQGRPLLYNCFYLQRTIPALFVALLLTGAAALAQPPRMMRSLGTAEGLCSNHIYSILEDRAGFLWIATDNGISRYDGHHFINFSTADGLPENEVLGMEQEKDGTLWVSCFNGACAWYDGLHNRFVVPTLPFRGRPVRENTGNIFFLVPLLNGGMQYANESVAYLFKGRRLAASGIIPEEFLRRFTSLRNPWDAYSLGFERHSGPNNAQGVFLSHREAILDSTSFYCSFNCAQAFEYRDGLAQYLLPVSLPFLYRYRIRSLHPFHIAADSVQLANPATRLLSSENTLVLFSANGMISVREKLTMRERYSIDAGHRINCVFEDSHRNLWVGTNDRGICLYQYPVVHAMPTPRKDADSNLMSLAALPGGGIAAGNYNGQLIAYNHSPDAANVRLNDLPRELWVRSLVVSNGKIFAFSDQHSTANGNPIPAAEGYGNRGGKWAIALSDTILLVANVSPHGGLYTVNTRTCTSRSVPVNTVRVQLVEKVADGRIYFTGLSGLHRFDPLSQQAVRVLPEKKELSGRITAIAAARDSTCWVMTASYGLQVLKGEKIIGAIAPGNRILSSITCLCAGERGQMFAGTRQGIYRIIYRTAGNRIRDYDLASYAETDGLPGNDIAAMLVGGDTLYAATAKGLAALPVRLPARHYDIETHLVYAGINRQDAALANQYRLKSDENAIMLRFAGVELGGHLRELEYRLDKEAAWTTMPGNSLNLLLKSGRHRLQVRAVDHSGHASKHIAIIGIDVDTPLLQTVWFRALAGILLAGLVIYAIYRRKLQQTRVAFRQQLRVNEERRRITADLHDDIGANLSGLQLYSAVAGRLIGSNAEKAKEMLEKIAAQAAAVQDNLGDIIWSMKPSDEGFVSTTGRIKNFVSEVLDAAGIDYTISLDGALDKASDIVTRKNVLLIVKEAVNNCVKYSRARHVSITAKTEGDVMIIIIADDGIGFDVAAAARSGNGLTNIRRRTEELGGECIPESKPAEGAMITCRFPLLRFRDTAG